MNNLDGIIYSASYALIPIAALVIDTVYGGVSPYPAYGAYAGIYQQYQFMYSRDGGLEGHIGAP